MRKPVLWGLTATGLSLSLLACSSSPLTGAKSDALENSCTGGSPWAVINGVASKPKVTGALGIFNCCEGASFTVETSSFDYKVMADWSVVAGDGVFPATIDLANPSEGWRSSVNLTCASGEVCYPPPDGYDSGIEGWLVVARAGEGRIGSGFHMTICLRVAETPETPHPLLHSFGLFASDISTSSVR